MRTPDPAPKRPCLLERVGDAAVAQLHADGFGRLALRERLLLWHLYEAALAGRDIYVDQRCPAGLELRDLVEELLTHPAGIAPGTLERVRRYAKLFWINNSPYQCLTARKFTMEGTPGELLEAARAAEGDGARLPRRNGETTEALLARLGPWLFDPEFEPMITAKNPPPGLDLVQASSVHFYERGLTLAEVEAAPREFELNATIVRGPDRRAIESPWRAGDPARGLPPGRYACEIGRIIAHLEEALPHAPPATRAALELLIRWYRSGRDEDFRAYNVAWLRDRDSPVDTINGFIEVYMDPRGKKGAWEAVVWYEDPKKTELIRRIAAHAQWFEDHMPYAARFRRPEVRGVSAKSIEVVIETGDSGPVTPIGINLPNPQDLREQHGSKSVSLANVVEAYLASEIPEAKREFCWDDAELDRAERWGPRTEELLTNLHEVIGHGSGRQGEECPGDPADRIREHFSSLEEARADLVALWFLRDPVMQELGLLDDPDEGARAAYERYTRNGALAQLRRAPHGEQLEEDHMRNRQLVVRWIEKHTRAIEWRVRDGKHYFVVVDPAEWRAGAGRLLALVQELKSTGDYEGTKRLFDEYGIRFDPGLRDEVVERYRRLDVPAYTGFVMPRLQPLRDAAGRVTDVRVSYPMDLEQQMLEWSGRRAPPPV